MKTIPVLSNGLPIAFADLHIGINALTREPTLHGFVVTLGDFITFGAMELYEIAPRAFAECQAIGEEIMRARVMEQETERVEMRDWLSRQ